MSEPQAKAEDRLLDALIEVIKAANSTDVWEAQTILLRRLALQGDVVGSRVPAPRNITEIGGYLNLLGDMQQPEMRAQTLAGILGVAVPNPPLGWTANKPLLALASLPNDRPEGRSQPSIPLTFVVRSDFVPALQAALTTLHDRGCKVPLLASQQRLLNAIPGMPPPGDALPYLGRVLDIVPATSLHDPATDPIGLVRATGTTDPFQVAGRVIAPGSVTVPSTNWDVLRCTNTACTQVAVAGGQFVPLAPAFATAGFHQPVPPSQPTSLSSTAWARFTNITGLVADVTTLGDELRLLYTNNQIAASAFASQLHWVWKGTTFVQP